MKTDSTYVTCQVPRREGTPCFNEPDLRNPWGICRTHWEAIARAWRPLTEQPRRVRCIQCSRLSALTHDGQTAYCADPECGASFPVLREAPAPTSVDVVYYMRFADRIKIGTTTNLLSRSKSIYHDEVLAIELGGVEEERTRHRQFADLLINGQREWFRAEPRLLEHASHLRNRNGEPFAAFQTWYQRTRSVA